MRNATDFWALIKKKAMVKGEIISKKEFINTEKKIAMAREKWSVFRQHVKNLKCYRRFFYS